MHGKINPNKGAYDVAADKHLEPQYDMNGYTVKFYYDPAYFAFAGEKMNEPINYRLPNEQWDGSTVIIDGTEVTQSANVGFYVYQHGSDTTVLDGKQYNTAYATVMFSGTYLPQRPDGDNWYNLCALPLKPLRVGSSDVFIEIDSTDPCTLELLAKNVSDEYLPYFNFTAVNSGYHTINIKDKLRPAAPIADPIAGSYTEKQKVTLKADDDCRIWYSTGSGFVEYTGPIDVELTTTIECYAERITDGKRSNTVSYEYKILPKKPYLFIDSDGTKQLVSNMYNSNEPFTVYASDSEIFGNISDDSEVYYTFSSTADALNPEFGDDPETQWVKVDKRMQSIDIDKTCIVRLITKKQDELSEPAWYSFGIRPSPVKADPGTGVYDNKVDVKLSTESDGAEIYYTIDGSDPRANGVLYTDNPLTLYKDTTLRAVAKYNDVYSEVATFYYQFTAPDSYAVSAFYPPGIYESGVNVTLTAENPDNTIYYTLDGATWQKYTPGTAMQLTDDTTIQAYTEDNNGIRGDTYSFVYKIKPKPPVFAPETTQFSNNGSVTVYAPEAGDEYELYYTTDGSDPMLFGTKADSDNVTVDINKYTVISAAIRKNGTNWSTVVTHSYDIVKSKPVKPITTLDPGSYTLTPDMEGGYTTAFVPVSSGVKIYYTIAHKTSEAEFAPADPVPGAEGTYEYTPGDELPVIGQTMIKAVAVNTLGIKSDIGIFNYTIAPEAPKMPPNSVVSGKLPVVPVTAVPGADVTYTINGFTNTVKPEDGLFYIDTATGNAYADKECTKPLGEESDMTITSPAVIDIYAELDHVKSIVSTYRYSSSDSSTFVAAPYSDKESGTYDEIDMDGEGALLMPKLYSLTDGADIEYMENNSGEWKKYDGTLKLYEDMTLLLRAVKDGNYSASVSYIYIFRPLPPVIKLVSGRYSETQYTTISYDPRAPKNRAYTIKYRRNGDRMDYNYYGYNIEIDHTMSLKAYVEEDNGAKRSDNSINFYIIESAAGMNGKVYLGSPYDASPRYSSDVISTPPYSDGIKLVSDNNNATINYYYSYTLADGKTYTTGNFVYDNSSPIFASASMTDITITAWLTDDEGNVIEDSESIFPIEFVKLLVPKPSIEDGSKAEFPKGTKFTIVNDYPEDKDRFIYYTTNGSMPNNPDNKDRKLYNGETLSVDGTITIKTVYYDVCGICVKCKDGHPEECWHPVYGTVGTYIYTTPSSGGGGGGGGHRPTPTPKPDITGGNTTDDRTRRYTHDVFGNEHPTHIGYIYGYPDGSVRPDGNITREETAAIIYRVRNKTYEEPVPERGDVYSDVKSGRWSCGDIEYLTHYKVIYGYEDGTFRPENEITRAEFAALIRRFIDAKYEGDETPFPDVKEDEWYYEDVCALRKTGYLEGYEDGTFRPEQNITRAEAMVVFNKILGRNPDEDYVKSLDFNPYNDLDITKWHYVTVLEATITHNYYLNKEDFEALWEDYK